MSTNPFDSDFPPSSSSLSRGGGGGRQHYVQHQHQHEHFLSNSNDSNTAAPSYNNTGSHSSGDSSDDLPIWEARHVEWPLVSSCFTANQHHLHSHPNTAISTSSSIKGGSSLPLHHHHHQQQHHHYKKSSTGTMPFSYFKKFYKQSCNIGNQLGISFCYNVITSNSTTTSATITINSNTGSGGFMGKFIGSSSNQNMLDDEFFNNETSQHISTTIRPPKSHCIASANGWIMAAVESLPITIHPSSPSSSSTAETTYASSNANISNPTKKSTSSTTATTSHELFEKKNKIKDVSYQLPPLRLVSRWNVRHGSANENHYEEGLIPLPPPIISTSFNTTNNTHTTTSTSTTKSTFSTPTRTTKNKNITNSMQSNPILAGRIMHIFTDPTGCHTIISAQNGEAYYMHTLVNKNVVRKLKGFGPTHNITNTSGNNSSSSSNDNGFIPGCALSELSCVNSCKNGGGSSDAILSKVQFGITPGSYITSVGWDKERGTEGSTKNILIGTSYGEIYEYSLHATLFSSKDGSLLSNSSNNHKTIVGSSTSASVGSEEEVSAVLNDKSMPMLLVRLNANENSSERFHESNSNNYNNRSDAAAVTGLHFVRFNSFVGVSSNMSGRSSLKKNGGTDGNIDLIVLAVTSGFNKHTRFHTYLSMPSSEEGRDDTSSYVAMSTSASDYSFFHRAFAYDEATSRKSFVELPGSINYADLKICEERFAMRTETGIYFGSIDMSTNMDASINKGTSGVVDAGMLPYETSGLPVSIAITPYHVITLSDSGEVRFINRISKTTIQKEDRLDLVTMGQRAGIVDNGFHGVGNSELIMDIRKPNQVWLWKSNTLIHISSTREDRDVWKFSLESCLMSMPKMSLTYPNRRSQYNDDIHHDAKFDDAKNLCTNNLQKAVVTAARAKYHLLHNRIELAAKYMAQCPSELMPFAETCVQLSLPMFGVSSEENKWKSDSCTGLISYLLQKMQYYKATNDSVACTMLGTWLVELYLYERERNGSFDVHLDGKSVQAQSNSGNNVLLQQFLSSNAYNMDAKTILHILCCHDATATECELYAASSGDIGTAVNAALCIAEVKNGALDALRVLSDSPIEQAEPYYYKHAFILLSRAPIAASKSFLARFSQGLSATRLLPAFMRYETKRIEIKGGAENKSTDKGIVSNSVQIGGFRSNGLELSIDSRGSFDQSQSFVDDGSASITFFEGAITLGCRSPAIYNFLVSLYVNMEDESPLYDFVSKHVSSVSTLPGTQPKQTSPLDMNYTLSTILQSGRHFRSAIKLYMGFGMRFRAVELAIKVDPDLAKQLASESVERDEQKRLWTMIARNAAIEGGSSGGKEVVSNVLAILHECSPGVLSIEDVLPFLPDVAQIDQFKDEICATLTSYSSKIEMYMEEMSNCDQTCHSLRDTIRRLGDFTTAMYSEARCGFTGRLVTKAKEPFYVFPSGYVFLEGALQDEILPYLNEQQKLKVQSIEKEIYDLKEKTSSTNYEIDWGKSEVQYKLESLQFELDGLLAAECPLTGYRMIESIDRGFEDSKEDELYLSSEDVL